MVPVPKQRIEQKTVNLDWADVDSLPLYSATNFVTGALSRDEIMLVIGQAAPPIFPGTGQEQVDQLKDVEVIQARALARFILAPGRAESLIAVLQSALKQVRDIAASEGST